MELDATVPRSMSALEMIVLLPWGIGLSWSTEQRYLLGAWERVSLGPDRHQRMQSSGFGDYRAYRNNVGES